MNMLRIIRMILGILMLAAITFLFVDVSGFAAEHLHWLTHIQILPAFMAGNFIVVSVIVLLTLLFGRIYCSVICPMGLLQDLFGRLGFRARNRRYSYSPAKTVLRLVVLFVFILAMVVGLGSVVALLAPYSSFGRIAQNLFQPLYQLLNNLLAFGSESFDDYTFSTSDIWLRSLPVFIVALVTFVAVAVLAWRNGRTYCNTICPVGTILGYVAKFSLFAPVINSSKCVGCKMCEKNCKAACIKINGPREKGQEIDGSRCVTCFNCIDNCRQGAISYTIRYKRHLNEKVTSAEGQTAEGQSSDAPKADVSKRAFLVGLGLVAASAVKSQEDKVADGGLAIIEDKKPSRREVPLVPPGARSLRQFSRRCTGCQVCVAKCPNGVLRPSSDLATFMQPRMSYERGYCRPECNVCSVVCPAGAIEHIDLSEKSSIVIGHAVWVADRCVVNAEGVKCGNCARHCPMGAIAMVKHPDNPDLRIPAVHEDRCIGCGACEHVCPTRPLSAIYVEGHENHRVN